MHTCAHQLMSGHLLWILNCIVLSVCFFFNDTATTEIYTLSLHDALPIWVLTDYTVENGTFYMVPGSHRYCRHPDRKSTRLNSSHTVISYAVFCLKKKKKNIQLTAIAG